MGDYAARLAQVTARIRSAEVESGRAGAAVRILVATKTRTADQAAAVCAAGARLVGENRVQELVAKGPTFAAAGVEAHLIGPLQRNKAKDAIAWARVVQTVDSVALAERLSDLAAEVGRAVAIMVQANVSGEESKHGVPVGGALDLASRAAALPWIEVRGFMTVGLNSRHERAVRAGYAALRDVRDAALVRAERGDLPGLAGAWELSMGMSGDLEWAIAEGATMVRVGSAILGPRE